MFLIVFLRPLIFLCAAMLILLPIGCANAGDLRRLAQLKEVFSEEELAHFFPDVNFETATFANETYAMGFSGEFVQDRTSPESFLQSWLDKGCPRNPDVRIAFPQYMLKGETVQSTQKRRFVYEVRKKLKDEPEFCDASMFTRSEIDYERYRSEFEGREFFRRSATYAPMPLGRTFKRYDAAWGANDSGEISSLIVYGWDRRGIFHEIKRRIRFNQTPWLNREVVLRFNFPLGSGDRYHEKQNPRTSLRCSVVGPNIFI